MRKALAGEGQIEGRLRALIAGLVSKAKAEKSRQRKEAGDTVDAEFERKEAEEEEIRKQAAAKVREQAQEDAKERARAQFAEKAAQLEAQMAQMKATAAKNSEAAQSFRDRRASRVRDAREGSVKPGETFSFYTTQICSTRVCEEEVEAEVRKAYPHANIELLDMVKTQDRDTGAKEVHWIYNLTMDAYAMGLYVQNAAQQALNAKMGIEAPPSALKAVAEEAGAKRGLPPPNLLGPSAAQAVKDWEAMPKPPDAKPRRSGGGCATAAPPRRGQLAGLLGRRKCGGAGRRSGRKCRGVPAQLASEDASVGDACPDAAEALGRCAVDTIDTICP